MSKFSPSKEQLPPSDKHDEIVKLLDSECATLREKCWAMRDLVKKYHDVRADYEASIRDGHPGNLDDMMEAFRDCSAMEREIIDLRKDIEHRVENYNFGRDTHQRIYLSHTEEGLPIRVSKTRKVPLWGI